MAFFEGSTHRLSKQYFDVGFIPQLIGILRDFLLRFFHEQVFLDGLLHFLEKRPSPWLGLQELDDVIAESGLHHAADFAGLELRYRFVKRGIEDPLVNKTDVPTVPGVLLRLRLHAQRHRRRG